MTINEDSSLSCIEIEPTNPANTSIIWLHGLGADGNDFVSVIPELNLPPTTTMRFIFPHAPIMPVTINNGYKMRAWYDIYAIAIDAKIDRNGINQSVRQLEKLIQREISRGIDTKNIFLAGFSQGAAIALTTGLCYPASLAGIIALSGYLPLANEVLQKASVANRHTPIFLAHGTEDPIVPYTIGKMGYDILRQAAYPVTWHSYTMLHSICEAEINDISQWLQDRV